jgi:hypothetical protein
MFPVQAALEGLGRVSPGLMIVDIFIRPSHVASDVNHHQVLWSMLLADGWMNFAMLINPGKWMGRQLPNPR